MKHKPKDQPQSAGNLFVFSAPSGAGKTSLVKALTQGLSDVTVSISHTTRPKRPTEEDNVNYHFVTPAAFQTMIDDNQFLEHATIFGNRYGTSRQWVEETLTRGNDVILEIDWQGCQSIQRLFKDCISIFIVPPSPAILKKRLTERGQDRPEIIAERLADANETFSHLHEFDYIVLNDSFEHALSDLQSIIIAHRLKRERQTVALAPLLSKFV